MMSVILGQSAGAYRISDGGDPRVVRDMSVHIRRRVRTPSVAVPTGAGRLQATLKNISHTSADGPTVRDIATRPHALTAPTVRPRASPSEVDLGIVMSVATAVANQSPDLHLGLRTAISGFRMNDDDPATGDAPATRLSGTQSVARALDLLDAIAARPMGLAELAAQVGLSTTTCYRLASALVARGMLANSGRTGYALGERIAELGISLAEQRERAARN